MKAFILGVPSKYRGAPLEAQLKELGIAFEVIQGIDGQVLSETERAQAIDQEIARARYGRELSIGEACCSLGHQAIARKMIEEEDEWAFVFEDDAVIVGDLSSAMVALAGLSTKSVIQLFSTGAVPTLSSMFRRGKTVKRIVTGGYGTVGYILGIGAAQTIIKQSNPSKASQLADWPFNWRWRIKFYVANGQIVSTQDGDSLIGGERHESSFGNLHSIRASGETFVRTIKTIQAGGGFLDSFMGILVIEYHKQFVRLVMRVLEFSKSLVSGIRQS